MQMRSDAFSSIVLRQEKWVASLIQRMGISQLNGRAQYAANQSAPGTSRDGVTRLTEEVTVNASGSHLADFLLIIICQSFDFDLFPGTFVFFSFWNDVNVDG